MCRAGRWPRLQAMDGLYSLKPWYAARLRDARLRLQPNDPVHVPRFDKPGKVVRVDHKRNVAVVSVGLGQWEVPLEDVFPAEK